MFSSTLGKLKAANNSDCLARNADCRQFEKEDVSTFVCVFQNSYTLGRHYCPIHKNKHSRVNIDAPGCDPTLLWRSFYLLLHLCPLYAIRGSPPSYPHNNPVS